VIFAVVIVWLNGSTPVASETASFTGYTNGLVGAIAPTFGTMSTNYAATIQRWMDAGTNAALFTISNQQVCAIWISPFVTIGSGDTGSSREFAPLLNAPDFSGIRVAPKQVVTAQVAIVRGDAPWSADFYYTRDSCSDSLPNRLRMIPEQLRALTTRTPLRVESHTVQSGLIEE